MTNFERYIDELTQDKFIDSMILNCDGRPVDDGFLMKKRGKNGLYSVKVALDEKREG